MTPFKWLSLISLLILSQWTCPSLCQGGGSVDTETGAENLDSQDTGGAPAGDPSIINPPNKQGYGRNVPTQLEPTKKPPRNSDSLKPATTTEQTIAEQSVQAALQFGVLVGVALMVGILFMVNIGVEMCFDAICERVSEAFGKQKIPDIEDQDPAGLVGTFKRYK